MTDKAVVTVERTADGSVLVHEHYARIASSHLYLSEHARDFLTRGEVPEHVAHVLNNENQFFWCVTADEQYEGVGSVGEDNKRKKWHDIPGSLKLSLLRQMRGWRPPMSEACAARMVAWFGAEIIDALNKKLFPAPMLGLKWPNDVVEAGTGKKVGGVLTELVHANENGAYVCVSLGLNLSGGSPEVPEAVGVSDLAGRPVGVEEAREAVMQTLTRPMESAPVVAESTFFGCGRMVDCLDHSGKAYLTGRLAEYDLPNGRLRVDATWTTPRSLRFHDQS